MPTLFETLAKDARPFNRDTLLDVDRLESHWGIVPDYRRTLAKTSGKLVRLDVAVWCVIGFCLEALAKVVARKFATILGDLKKTGLEMAGSAGAKKWGGAIGKEIAGRIEKALAVHRGVRAMRAQETLVAKTAERWAHIAWKFSLGQAKDRVRRVKVVRVRLPQDAGERAKAKAKREAAYQAEWRRSRRKEIAEKAKREIEEAKKPKVPKWWPFK